MKKLKMLEGSRNYAKRQLSRKDIIEWYESLEIPYSKKSSTEYLIDHFYHILHTYDCFVVHPQTARLDDWELVCLSNIFGVELVYDEGPLYYLKEKGSVSE